MRARSASAARILAEFFPDRGETLNTLVIDAGMSRVYAGIHYRFEIALPRFERYILSIPIR